MAAAMFEKMAAAMHAPMTWKMEPSRYSKSVVATGEPP